MAPKKAAPCKEELLLKIDGLPNLEDMKQEALKPVVSRYAKLVKERDELKKQLRELHDKLKKQLEKEFREAERKENKKQEARIKKAEEDMLYAATLHAKQI